ncbi:MAG: hypothetical protein CME68_05660 [Halobacteriovoraceae bacterium]|nr:hypothetical protein [Halobacteriovoraceae bacterium]
MKLTVFLFLFTFSQNSISQLTKKLYKWGKIDDPEEFLLGYETKFKNLPLKGQLKNQPWSGYYWPTYKGGITYRWQNKSKNKKDNVTYNLISSEKASKLTTKQISLLSPSEKWDLFLSDYNFNLTKYERERTGVMTKKDIPAWFGLCHAWAPATLQYSNPKPIELKNHYGQTIKFGSSDIKALLTYDLHLQGEDKAKMLFLGGRCNANLPTLLKMFANNLISEDKMSSLIPNMNCQDMNPGAVHLALTNLIGLRQKGFVMDKTRTGEVWNQAVWSYHTSVEKTHDVKSWKKTISSMGQTVIPLESSLHPTLDPEKILTVRTVVGWINEHLPNWSGKDLKGKSTVYTTYRYYLYINRYGDIVGGMWHPKNKERPDFFWRASSPGYSEYMRHLSHFEGKSFDQIGQMDSKGRKRSRQKLKKILKRVTKKIILAKRFIKNSKEINKNRRKSKKGYTDNLKSYLLKNMKSLKRKWKKVRGTEL